MTQSFRPAAEQTADALRWTRYGKLARDDVTNRWWVLLSPAEHAPSSTPGTALDAGTSFEPPIAIVSELLSSLDLVPRSEWKPRDRYMTDRTDGYGRVLYYAGVWPTRNQADAENRLAAAMQYRDAGLRRETRIRTTTASVMAGALLLAIAPMPSGYYEALRWLIMLAGIVLAVLTFRASGERWGWIVGILGAVVLWNPLSPIYLERATWLFLDLAAAALLCLFALWSKNRPPRDEYFPIPELGG